jgi:hypothetical protein
VLNLTNTSTYPRTRSVLDAYKRYVVSQSKANLTRGRQVNGKKKSYKASGKLYGSIKGYVTSKMNRSVSGKFTGGSTMPGLTFEMAEYGKFIDEGVKGSKSNYIENRNSPNKFRNGKKSVPTGEIEKWCRSRGISEKLAFVIARSIYQKGIKASHFFTKPLEKRNKTMWHQYHRAIADDIATNFANKIASKLRKSKKV